MFTRRTITASLAALLLCGFQAFNLHAQAPPATPPAVPPTVPPAAAPKIVDVKDTSEKVSFDAVDGVKLSGYFHKSKSGSDSPSIIMLHPFGSDSDVVTWRDTANSLAEAGYNVLRFDFRGHGKSTGVDPSNFWNPRAPWANYNIRGIGGSNRGATKDNIDYKEFRTNYYPMLLQDIAAARSLMDLKNDNGTANTSTIYLVGAGDAINLGMAYIATEWLRERKKPNVPIPAEYVSTRRALFPGSDPAAQDIGGAVWIGPDNVKGNAISYRDIKNLIISSFALKTRDETQMLFMAGEKDRNGTMLSKMFYDQVLLVDSAYGPGRVKLTKPKQTFIREIEKSSASGIELLNGNPAADKMIKDFLKAVDEERRSKTRKTVDWDKPLYIDLASFGL